jgi:glycosyltransferase involved in cell wall biosynthesis
VQGTQVDGRSVDLAGWVLGRSSPAVGVELVHDGAVIRRVPISVSRPDVAVAYSQVTGAERSGFRTSVSVLGAASEVQLTVQVVLQNQSRVALGVITVRRGWYKEDLREGASLVSVIIPCYNQAHFLAEAIESVLAQTYPQFEIVVVDDGSTDNTSEIAARYPGARCIRQDNQGLAEARNTGIRKSNGNYLVFLDADDRLLPDALGAGLTALNSHPDCAFVFGRCRVVGIDGAPLPGWQQPHFDEDYYGSLLRGNYIWMPAMVMYRRAVFESGKAFSPQMKGTEDYALYLEVTRNCPIYFHGQEVAEYRQHHAHMTSNTALLLRSSLAALQKQWRYVKANPQYKEAYRVGLRFWRTHYGGRLATEIPDQIRLGQWKRALSEIALLLRYYPGGLAALLHDWFVLWKYFRGAPARAGETDAADKAVKTKTAEATLPVHSDGGSGASKH